MKTKLIVLSVPVLASDIARGDRCDSESCMVARAVKRLVRPSLHEEIGVGTSGTTVNGTYSKHTEATVTRIERWDTGETNIKPFSVRVKFQRSDLRPSVLRSLGL